MHEGINRPKTVGYTQNMTTPLNDNTVLKMHSALSTLWSAYFSIPILESNILRLCPEQWASYNSFIWFLSFVRNLKIKCNLNNPIPLVLRADSNYFTKPLSVLLSWSWSYISQPSLLAFFPSAFPNRSIALLMSYCNDVLQALSRAAQQDELYTADLSKQF